MTDRPEKWEGLERIAAKWAAKLESGHREPTEEEKAAFLQMELAREFGPLLDAAERVRHLQIRGHSLTLDTAMAVLTSKLEKFR